MPSSCTCTYCPAQTDTAAQQHMQASAAAHAGQHISTCRPAQQDSCPHSQATSPGTQQIPQCWMQVDVWCTVARGVPCRDLSGCHLPCCAVLCCAPTRELAAKQMQAALQPSNIGCSDLHQELSGLAALHEELGVDTTEQQLLLGQVSRVWTHWL